MLVGRAMICWVGATVAVGSGDLSGEDGIRRRGSRGSDNDMPALTLTLITVQPVALGRSAPCDLRNGGRVESARERRA